MPTVPDRSGNTPLDPSYVEQDPSSIATVSYVQSLIEGVVNATSPVLKAAANNAVEGLVKLTRADNVDRTHQLRYRGGGLSSTDYVALDTHDGSLTGGVGGYTEAQRWQRGRAYPRGGFLIESRAAAVAISIIPAIVVMVQTLGYAAEGDGGGGLYKRVGANPTSHQGKFATVDGTYFELVGPNCNVKQFGAVGDDATDCHAAFQNAIAFTNTKGGGVVHIPAGTYRRVTNTSITMRSNVSLVGDGLYVTKVKNDVAATSTMFSGDDRTGISFRHFAIEGAFEDASSESGGSLVRMDRPTDVVIDNMYVSKSRSYGMFFPWVKNIQVTESRFHMNARDNLALYNGERIRVQFNLFTCSPEDSVAFHNLSSSPIASEGNLIDSNIIIECPGPHGTGHSVTVTNNILIRPRAHGIHVLVERDNTNPVASPLVSIVVANNSIVDCFKKPDSAPGSNKQGYIFIGNAARHSATNTPNGPGMPNGSGGINDLLGTGDGHYYAVGVETGASVPIASPGGLGILCINNTCLRTRPDVANVSQWTLDPRGLFEAGQGVSEVAWYDGPSTGLLNVCPGLVLAPGTMKARVAGNIIAVDSPYAIVIQNEADSEHTALPFNWDDLVIEDNQLLRFTVAGVGVEIGAGIPGTAQSIWIRRNLFDGDPNHTAAGRLANGKWNTASTGPYALDAQGCTGIRFVDNDIANVFAPTSGLPAASYVRRNRLLCNPNTTGAWHADNIGIGNCPHAGTQYEYILMDYDPASATYKHEIGNSAGEATAMPSTGKYVRGTFVQCVPPSVSGGKVLVGWWRLTTGSAHVDGTDWVAQYSTTS